MDVFEASSRVLALAANGASHSRIVAVHQHLRQDEIRLLLKTLVDRNLLKMDSSSVYWTTPEGAKFLELQFHMERILHVQESLI